MLNLLYNILDICNILDYGTNINQVARSALMLRSINFIKVSALVLAVVAVSSSISASSVNAMQGSPINESASTTTVNESDKVVKVSGIQNSQSHSETAPSQPTSDIPLEIIPICSDAASMTSQWTVTNKNDGAVKLDWNNIENNRSGTFQAVSGQSKLVTFFNAADPNNRTVFNYSGNESATNAQVAPCAPTTPPVEETPCVDGSDAQMLNVSAITRDATKSVAGVTVTTINGGLLCEDITLYFSSYEMPDNYDGKGFENNPTAYPQTIFSSVHLTLKKGTNGQSAFIVELPSKCKNVQVDLYYGPEIRTVGPNGHGTQNILAEIYTAENSCTPGNGGGGDNGGGTTPPVTPTTPITPVPGNGGGDTPKPEKVIQKAAEPTVTPAELPRTGASSNLGMLYVLLLAAMTYGAVYIVNPKRA